MNIQIDPMTNLPQVPEDMFWRVISLEPEDRYEYSHRQHHRTKPTLQLQLHQEVDGGVGWFGRNLPKKSKVVGSRMFYEFMSLTAIEGHTDKFLEEHPNEGWTQCKEHLSRGGYLPVTVGLQRYLEPTPELFKKMGESIWMCYINTAHAIALEHNERYDETRKHYAMVNKYVGDYPPKRLED